MTDGEYIRFVGGGPWNGQVRHLPIYPDGYRFKIILIPPEMQIPVATGTLQIKPDYRVGIYEVWDSPTGRWAIWRGVEN